VVKAMEMILEWEPPEMVWDFYKCKEIPSKSDQENIFLSVCIKGLSEDGSYRFLADLEDAVNRELQEAYGNESFMRCSGYAEEEDGVLYDTIGWKRDLGNVSEQKRKILKVFRNSYKQLRGNYV
jgi:hypothetical protein